MSTVYITMTNGTIQTAEHTGKYASDGPDVDYNGNLVIKDKLRSVAYFPAGTWVSYSNSAPVSTPDVEETQEAMQALGKKLDFIDTFLSEFTDEWNNVSTITWSVPRNANGTFTK